MKLRFTRLRKPLRRRKYAAFFYMAAICTTNLTFIILQAG
jgi:hypothetical protein